MQLAAGVWIGERNFLIQFNSQTRFGRWDDEAALKFDRCLHEFCMKALPPLNGFKNQKVWRTCGELNVGSGNNWSAI